MYGKDQILSKRVYVLVQIKCSLPPYHLAHSSYSPFLDSRQLPPPFCHTYWSLLPLLSPDPTQFSYSPVSHQRNQPPTYILTAIHSLPHNSWANFAVVLYTCLPQPGLHLELCLMLVPFFDSLISYAWICLH